MKIVVVDANIFIDLLQADLLPAFLNLGYVNHAPPSIIAEVREDNMQMLIDAVETDQILTPIIKDLNSHRGRVLKFAYSPGHRY